MPRHARAGKTPHADDLVDVPNLITRYYTGRPDPGAAAQRVSFGTSGHRGTSLDDSFCDGHIAAIAAAIVEHRRTAGIDGPLFIGRDTHALSEPAFATAVEVLAAHDVDIVIDCGSAWTPTPVISHAIRRHNRARSGSGSGGLADGIVITPSHNPPQDGGFKYNAPHGGPADTAITSTIQQRANELMAAPQPVLRMPLARALASPHTHREDFAAAYVDELGDVLDMDASAAAGLRLGADPMGGAALGLYERIADRYRLDVHVVGTHADPQFSFMTLDWDGRIRMDCSSPDAMAGLIALRDRFDVAFGNDPDADRHGIVTRSAGLMNPNHFLAVAVWYLFRHRNEWNAAAGIGKTLVSSSMIDRVAASLGRPLVEVPVGFKWFVDGLDSGTIAFGGEESAGASFVRKDGTAWTTDKDGVLLSLLAAEITAVEQRDPAECYRTLTAEHGEPVYERMDAAATPEQKRALASLDASAVATDTLAGDPITARLTHAPGNGAPIGGLKVTTRNGWFAARPSGTENVYKIYAESFAGTDHLRMIQQEAQQIVEGALSAVTAV